MANLYIFMCAYICIFIYVICTYIHIYNSYICIHIYDDQQNSYINSLKRYLCAEHMPITRDTMMRGMNRSLLVILCDGGDRCSTNLQINPSAGNQLAFIYLFFIIFLLPPMGCRSNKNSNKFYTGKQSRSLR